ncbi:ATP synthase subunit I [Nitrosococcus wardiae]|uniref:ATP synthase subunit I n=1 Tax=Nitrosococcus wardiae TaxID=1814290 RepID=A0A4P7BWS1_9GAMM|nr:ATP synthase subunit I [Nitrosococcus wardiae]QBQ54543.1 ATP synthase subunit I [Nitrosococcus wardiae]
MEYAEFGLIIVALLGGMLLGGFYFGGLWFTVRRLPYVGHPALWMMLSLMLRSAVVLAGFYFLFGRHWEQILAALGGMLIIRTFFVRRLRPKSEEMAPPSSRRQQV